jgi:hypothetical protein
VGGNVEIAWGKGRRLGRGKAEVVINLLQDGMLHDQIATLIGLSLEEIERLISAKTNFVHDYVS